MDLEQKAKELEDAIFKGDVFKTKAIQHEIREWYERFHIDMEFLPIEGTEETLVHVKICKGGCEILLTPDEANKVYNTIEPYKKYGYELPF